MNSISSTVRVLRSVTGLRRFSFSYDRFTGIEKKSNGCYSCIPTNCLSIRDSPNGGYLMNLAIKCAINNLEVNDPITVTGYYVSKTAENKTMDIHIELLSKSKSSSSALISCSQEGILRSKFLGTFGNLAKFKGFTKINKVAPSLPPVSDCLDAMKELRKFMGSNMSIANEIELRLPSTNAFAQSVLLGNKVNDAHLMGWCSFQSNRKPCVSSLSFLCDAFPPPVLGLQFFEWVPTLEYTVHFWNDPSTVYNSNSDKSHLGAVLPTDPDYGRSWLRYTCESTFIQNGMLYADNELWTADGKHLLATSRQLAMVRNPINK